MTLRQGLCHISGLTCLTRMANTTSLRPAHLPDRPMRIITLAHREQGLMTAPGNPKGIRSLADLARADVSFINRNPGSGTRLWLDQQLQTLGIPREPSGDTRPLSARIQKAPGLCSPEKRT